MPSKPKPRHTLRLVEAPGIGPLTAWRDLKPNSLLWLRWFLENGGALPASCHFVIAERLQPFIAAVTARPELRDELLATVLPIPTREPEPPRHWIMPSIGKAYSDDRDPASEADVSEPDEAAPDAEGIGSQGGMLTAMLTRFPQEISASKPAHRAHRSTRRSTGVCETCGTEFEQPRGPSSKFCAGCRKSRALKPPGRI